MSKTPPAGLTMLDNFKPETNTQEPSQEAEALAHSIARAHGFVDRHPVEPVKRQRPRKEPTCSLTARISVRAHNAFVQYCDRERISYREAFDRLIALLDAQKK